MEITTHRDKEFGIYHWDTANNNTILVGQEDTLEEAMEFVATRYGERIVVGGTDRAQVVSRAGDVMYSVGLAQ